MALPPILCASINSFNKVTDICGWSANMKSRRHRALIAYLAKFAGPSPMEDAIPSFHSALWVNIQRVL